MKKTTLLIASAFAAAGLSAAPLTPEQALQRARGNAPANMVASVKSNLTPVYTERTAAGASAAYVFNTAEGYMVLGGDDLAYPVLGYSDKGAIDVENMSPELKWWLSEYARQIEWASRAGLPENPEKGEPGVGREVIRPLLTTQWDQGTPYNILCPKHDDKLCVTGCVATSMAQVMNYHKYPEVGEGIVKYKSATINRNLSLNFSKREFDWANMLDAYYADSYTEEQAEAVGYLMKACGYSVEMDYTPVMSGAQGILIGNALVEYFKYDKGTRSLYRLPYSSSQWEEMIYDNLKNVGPVIINGRSPSQGGHSFVCDGYDGNGYYHFNWGWGGISDGYFSLDALNPDAQGTGGSIGGFNFGQNGIFGIQPPTGQQAERIPGRVLQYGTTVASASGRDLIFDVADYDPLGWGNATTYDINVKVGAIVTSETDAAAEPTYVYGNIGGREDMALGMNSYYSNSVVKINVKLPDLPDGKYKVTLASLENDVENAQWQPFVVPWGYSNYCLVEIQGSSVTVENIPLASIEISGVEALTKVYSYKNCMLRAVVSNPTEVELTRPICPTLSQNGKRVYIGESMLINLMPGETRTVEWLVRFFTPGSGDVATVSKETEFDLGLYNPESGVPYAGASVPVTMYPSPGNSRLQSQKFIIADYKTYQMTVNGIDYYSVSVVPSLSSIPVELTIKNLMGYYDGQVTIGIYRQNPDYPSQLIPVIDALYTDYPFLSAGESRDYSWNIDFSEGEENVLYFVRGTYTIGSSVNLLGNLAFICNPTGVDDVICDSEAETEYYNLQGVRVAEPQPGEMVIVKTGGKTFKRVVR